VFSTITLTLLAIGQCIRLVPSTSMTSTDKFLHNLRIDESVIHVPFNFDELDI